eukprot:6178300-Pleurochrysis_carterae.AAC.2
MDGYSHWVNKNPRSVRTGPKKSQHEWFFQRNNYGSGARSLSRTDLSGGSANFHGKAASREHRCEHASAAQRSVSAEADSVPHTPLRCLRSAVHRNSDSEHAMPRVEAPADILLAKEIIDVRTAER